MKNSGNVKYFDLKLQTGSTVVKGICFSPEKRKQLDDMMKSQKPITLTNYEISKKFDITNVVINKTSKIKPCSSPIEFDRIDIENSTVKLSAMNTIMQGQLVNVKALVRQVGGSKVISKLSGEKLKKQEAVLVDPFGCVKIVLWENFVDSIECDQTYLFRNLRLKKDHYSSEIYVNTAMYGIRRYCPHFHLIYHLAEESATQLITVFSQTQIPAEIIGISNLTNHYTCKACNKGLEEKGIFGKCTSCHLTQKLVNANRRWSAKLFIQVTNEAKTLHLTLISFYGSQVVGNRRFRIRSPKLQ
jgi:hypothetical protein